MNFLHYEVNASPSNTIQIVLDKQANVRLMDDTNFSKYKRGDKFSFVGGLAKKSPINLTPPRIGNWHVVIDLGGYTGTVNASVKVL